MSGRPTDYTDQLAALICSRIAAGESLRSVCRDDVMPARTTIHRWLADETKKEFRDQYAQACDERAEGIFEEIIEIADTPVPAEKVVTKADGKQEVTTGDAVERSKLQVDARKWVVARMAPKKYGDKLNVEATGKDGAPLPPAVVQIYLPSNGRD
jgi:hypothetical protein